MSSDDRKKIKLKEFAELVNQPYQPSSGENFNYIGLEHIEQQTLRINGIGNSSDVISQKHRFNAGDILFGKLRPYFRKVVRPSFDGVCSTDIWVVRAKPGFDQSFLFYFLANQSFIDACNSSSSGTRMPRADWNHLSETLWELPSLPEQKRIAEILSALDDKIELNRQTNATLEAIAQAIFKEWFVDFNYPGATGEMVESELGPIPKGWRVGRLGEICKVTMGQSPPGESYNEDGIGTPFFQGRADFDFRFPRKRVFTTNPSRFANKFDTLVSVRAPVGDMNIATENCCIGRGLAAVIERNGNYSFTYYFLKELTEQFKGFEDSGTVFGSINKNDFENLTCIIPTIEIITSYEEKCRVIDDEIFNCEQESRTLTIIRDAILPKLMSREIEL